MESSSLVQKEHGIISSIRYRSGGAHLYTGAIELDATPQQIAEAVKNVVDWMEEEANTFANNDRIAIDSLDPGYNWIRSNNTKSLGWNLSSHESRSYSMYYYATQGGYDYWVNATNRFTKPNEDYVNIKYQQTLHWTPTSYQAEKNGPTCQLGPSLYNYSLGLSGSGLSFSIAGSIPENEYEAQNSPSNNQFGGFVDHHRSSPSAQGSWEMDSGWRIQK